MPGTEAAPLSDDTKRVRLVFVDDGAYHRETLRLPLPDMQRYERLIDYLREDPVVLGRMYVDVERLCAAYIVENGDE